MVSTDAGMANERTALAWQRTALSLAAGAAVMARLTWSELGLVAALVLAVAVALGVWVFVESTGRYRHDAGTRSRGRGRSGRAPLALTVAVVLMCATEAFALVRTGT